MKQDDYKEDVKVDLFNLHLGYRDQSSNYMKWGMKWVNSTRERDKRKRYLRINAKSNPEKWGLPKDPSVAAVNALLEEDEELIELNSDVNTYATAMRAFEHRQRSLDGLVRLYLNGYFSGPHPETQRLVEQVREENLDELRKEQIDKLQTSKVRLRRRTHADEQSTRDSEEAEGGSSEAT